MSMLATNFGWDKDKRKISTNSIRSFKHMHISTEVWGTDECDPHYCSVVNGNIYLNRQRKDLKRKDQVDIMSNK